ncbi:MAG: hypothetical protein HC895_13860 [Leptolyngbyaceae cyanobacterium SM1_3_5]|nr:hypothetical protein [Leptolyngbyaceae cyanobacterium SM1_3_5]
MKYPRWFPFPTAWLKSFILLIVGGVAIGVTKTIFLEASEQSAYAIGSIEPIILSVVLIALSPIPTIAATHYLIHSILERVAPKLQADRVRKYPKLSGLWEGLLGWVAFWIATLITIIPICLFFSWDIPIEQQEEQLSSLSLAWWLIAAYVYHIEYLMRPE